jgi:hypothetical protein
LKLKRIVSGGQTGADRGALDAAIALRIPHGGWCPLGRKAEDGIIPNRYRLLEASRPDYNQRTAWNVRDSDATLVVVLRSNTRESMSPGSSWTLLCATTQGKPCLLVGGSVMDELKIVHWLVEVRPRVLNVAGLRESRAPGIQVAVRDMLMRVLKEPQCSR